MRGASFLVLLLLLLVLTTIGCTAGDDGEPISGPRCGTLEAGDPQGHPDPLGAKAAGQARAGRISDVSQLKQPAHGRQAMEDGDFLLINDKIAVVIEDADLSDGYGRFGGEILAIDLVGDDGRPLGQSTFVESLLSFGLATPNPTSVSVVADGSDGGEAVVRVIGPVEVIPFLQGGFSKLLPSDFDIEAAYDFVLEPGAERVLVRTHVLNLTPDLLDFGAVKTSSDENFLFFQYSHNQAVTPEQGFVLEGQHAWVGQVGYHGLWGFAFRHLDGPLSFGIEVSGFQLLHGPGYLADPCTITTLDRFEIIAGGPHYDGLREAIRRVDGEPSWSELRGAVREDSGAPVAHAWVHELAADGTYLSRVKADADGAFVIHRPPDAPVTLVAQRRGYRHTGVEVAPGSSEVDLVFEPHGRIHVSVAGLSDGSPLPARVQVIPSEEQPATPESYGVLDERRGRLHQAFAITGEVTLVVPPGEHQVIVSRGYEYEIHDEPVTVTAGQTAEVAATLEHSVDSTGVMCADFHIHTHMSNDSTDTFDLKVSSAVADGLEIPISSEHDWVVDFGPVVESLGLGAWAYGMPSSELTTFEWGHFGVVPLEPRPGELNNGAIDWIDRSPAEVFAAVDELPERPLLVVNHPRAGMGGYFSSVNFNTDTGQADTAALWSDNFDAIEVFNASDFDDNRNGSVLDWFTMLNLGMPLVAVGSSDSHHVRSDPVGYPRTCLYFGHDDPAQLSDAIVRDGVLSGNSVVSGGLMLTVLGPDGERPGATVSPVGGTATFTVTVESPSWLDADEIEVIVSGATVATAELLPLGEGTSNRYVNEVAVPVTSGDWVVIHARGVGDLSPLHPGRAAFAVSNPIFIE